MSVKQITTDDLRRMKGTEGLILQGCGGSLDEWVDGINDMLTESEILLNGTKFKAENCCVFENEGLTNLMFPFSEDVKLDVGKLAMWRLQTHSNFGWKGCQIMWITGSADLFPKKRQKRKSLTVNCLGKTAMCLICLELHPEHYAVADLQIRQKKCVIEYIHPAVTVRRFALSATM